jgi:Flp pilus assembly protein TadD
MRASLVAEGARFIQEGCLSEAADRFRKAIKADPNNADAANDLGVVLRRQKNFEKAVTAFQSALRLQPVLSRFTVRSCCSEKTQSRSLR